METKSTIHLLLIVCLSSHLLYSVQGSSPAPLHVNYIQDPSVIKACNATEFPSLCLSSIAPFLAPGKNDLISILQSELKACIDHTLRLKHKAIKIAANPSTPPDIVENLKSCTELYKTIIHDLRKVDIKEHIDEDDVNTGISAATALVTNCQDSFAEVPTSPSPLANLDRILKQMLTNCFGLLYLIVPQEPGS